MKPPTIMCGATWPDPDTEARVQAIREEEGRTVGLAECCGREVNVWIAYRCLECGRWAHASCLARHFQSAGESRYMIVGGIGHFIDRDMGPWTGGVTAVPHPRAAEGE